MSVFPETSVTLLAQIAARTAGDDEAAWVRFFELYAPAIGKFVELQGTAEHNPFDGASLDALLALAKTGLKRIFALQRKALKD